MLKAESGCLDVCSNLVHFCMAQMYFHSRIECAQQKETSPFWEDKPVPMDDFFHVMKEHIDNHHVIAASMDGSPEKTEDHITVKDGGCGMRKLPA